MSDSGRVVLVTGASRGIGAAAARLAAASGARVYGISRSPLPDDLDCVHLQADLADAASRNGVLERLLDEAGLPDLVIDCAGAFLLAELDDTSDALLREQLAINLEAPFAIARRLLPLMKQRGSGRHIIVGSVADHRGFPENAAYSASKFGLRGLHSVLVEEYRGTGVLCTLVSPGPTDTTVWDPFDPDNRNGFPGRSEMLTAGEVAETIIWAASAPAGVHIELIRLSPDRSAS